MMESPRRLRALAATALPELRGRLPGRTMIAMTAVCAAFSCAARNARAADPPARPSFVLIFTDDQGWADLGSFGSKKIRTPNLDRMAREGMRLTSFYAQAVCGPSRAALMTGCYPIRVGEPGNRKHQHTILHPDEVTIAEVLRSAGYATGCVGKWHLGIRSGDGWDARTMPCGQGFDSFYGTPLFNGATVRVEDTKFRSPILRNNEVVVEAVQSWDHITQDYTKEAVRFIRANKDRPFFLYLAHNMPHIPLGASEEFKGKSRYGPYGDAIEEIDWSTGEILRTLAELGIDKRTLVLFTSDNGPWIETTRGNRPGAQPLIPRNHSGTADPLRGYKMLTWEGGLRVPCLAWWPGRVPAAKTCDEVAATIDLLPTFAGLAGARLPEDRVLDGRDVRPLLFAEPGAASPHEAFYYFCYTHLQAVRSGRWKLVLPRPDCPKWTGWSGRFYASGAEKTELYDLAADVGEARDVADENPEVVARLMKLIEKAREDLGDYDRIGRGARFFDEGPKRPDMDFWKGRTPQAGARKAAFTPAKYDGAKPVGNLRFDFETGDLAGWTVSEGNFDLVVSDRKSLPNWTELPLNKQGKYHLSTVERRTGPGDDTMTGVIRSPVFLVKGPKMSFLVGGGSGPQTYVALCTLDGREVLKASGSRGPILRRVEWDVKQLVGQKVFLRIVDRKTRDWGHVTFDDFSAEGEIDADAARRRDETKHE